MTVEENPVPQAAPEEVTVEESDVPLAEPAYWALLNLLMSAVSVLGSAFLLAMYFFGRKENDEDEEEEKDNTELKRKGMFRLASAVPALGSVILFLLTENMSNTMRLADRWTPLTAAMLIGVGALALLSKKSTAGEDQSAEGTSAAKN